MTGVPQAKGAIDSHNVLVHSSRPIEMLIDRYAKTFPWEVAHIAPRRRMTPQLFPFKVPSMLHALSDLPLPLPVLNDLLFCVVPVF